MSAVLYDETECLVVRANARAVARAGPEGRIGAAFPHKDGTGFNVQLRALPVDGRIVLLPPDPANTDGERSHKDR